MNATLHLSLPDFDGPLDLLLWIVRSQGYALDSLPLAEITRQFLAYIKEAAAREVDLGSEYIATASWLILLKARYLAPPEKQEEKKPDDEDEKQPSDPHEELRRALLASITHEQRKQAELFLRERILPARTSHEQAADQGERPMPPAPSGESCTLADVLAQTAQALAIARNTPTPVGGLDPDRYSVEDRKAWLTEKLRACPAGRLLPTAPWFDEQPTREAGCALFLALLDLAQARTLHLVQARTGAPLYVQLVAKPIVA